LAPEIEATEEITIVSGTVLRLVPPHVLVRAPVIRWSGNIEIRGYARSLVVEAIEHHLVGGTHIFIDVGGCELTFRSRSAVDLRALRLVSGTLIWEVPLA
jgi:hypothetical protein